MIGMSVNKAKAGFFDRKKVIAATTRAERQVLSKFGAYTRQRARTSIRKSNKTSTPGKPPYSHEPHLLRNLIFFVYEPEQHSTIIGPARLNQRVGNAPEALEKGGPSEVLFRDRKTGGAKTIKKVNIKKRAYMQPAFDAEKQNMDRLWSNSIKP